MLDPLDERTEAMGLPFARYADDFLIVAKTKAEALMAMAAVKDYVEGRLKLIVNEDKSKVAPLGECDFLGFNVRGRRIRRTDKAAKRFKFRIQEITSRSRGVSMRKRIGELQRYCVGWFHYFKIGLSVCGSPAMGEASAGKCDQALPLQFRSFPPHALPRRVPPMKISAPPQVVLDTKKALFFNNTGVVSSPICREPFLCKRQPCHIDFRKFLVMSAV